MVVVGTVVVCLVSLRILAAELQSDSLIQLCQNEPEEAFRQWTIQHHKNNYNDNDTEYQIRQQIFYDNLEFIVQQNQDEHVGHELGLNQFADLSFEEFKCLSSADDFSDLSEFEMEGLDMYLDDYWIPDYVDWWTKGAVTSPKDQGKCGGCWAFSTTGAIEGINFNVTGQLISLSEQELLDCDTYDHGCNGGNFWNGFKWVTEQGGITTEQVYPFVMTDAACNNDLLTGVQVVSINDWTPIAQKDERALMAATALQPVSVGMNAYVRDFQFYSGGIYDGSCGYNLDHAVLIVGYGLSEMGGEYWLLKNSWGTTWGEGGFFKVKRNTGDPRGKCGIAMIPAVPIKTSANPAAPPSKPSSDVQRTVKCDALTSCPQGYMCCCMTRFLICWRWSCCPLDKGTCCPSSGHCCPQQFPICSMQYKTCLATTTNNQQTLPNTIQHLEM